MVAKDDYIEVEVQGAENLVFQLTVDNTLGETLNLLTRRKAFGIVSVPSARAEQLVRENLEHRKVRTVTQRKDNEEARLLDDDNGCFYLLSDPASSGCADDATLLFVGESIPSRDDESRKEVVKRQLEVYGVQADEIDFPTIRELYGLARGRTLTLPLYARDEEEAVLVWQGNHLGLGEDPGRRVMNYDRSLLWLNFVAVGEDDSGPSAIPGESQRIDPAEFTSYCEMLQKMTRVAKNRDSGVYSYGDDILAECSLSVGDETTRCIFTEFYSNHNWRLDPTSLLVLRIKAQILPECCGPDALRFNHPTKAAKRLADNSDYLLSSIVTDNNMEPKFHSGRGEEAKPDELVSADRSWDNLVDFYQWIDVYRKEIDLL